METRTMTVQRALTRRKIITSRLADLTDVGFIQVTKIANKDAEAVKEHLTKSQAVYDEFNSLVTEYNALTNAINQSNMTTQVKFRGELFTISALIAMKETFKFRKQRLQNIRTQHADAQRLVERANNDVQKQISDDSLKLFGRDEQGNPIQPTEEALQMLTRNAENNHAKVMVVGFDAAKYIESENAFVQEFEQEVDILLSESNAVTTITV